MTLPAFLMWVLNSGGSISIVSWILERVKFYQSLASDVKQYVFYGASVVVAILAYLILTFIPAHLLTVIAPVFSILYGTFITVFLGQMFHRVDKKA
jgi:hypothetical protein